MVKDGYVISCNIDFKQAYGITLISGASCCLASSQKCLHLRGIHQWILYIVQKSTNMPKISSEEVSHAHESHMMMTDYAGRQPHYGHLSVSSDPSKYF